jgi:hypothetical protein
VAGHRDCVRHAVAVANTLTVRRLFRGLEAAKSQSNTSVQAKNTEQQSSGKPNNRAPPEQHENFCRGGTSWHKLAPLMTPNGVNPILTITALAEHAMASVPEA